MTDEKQRELLKEAKKRLKLAVEDDAENYKRALEDLRFAYEPGAQWPVQLRADRLAEDRPCLEINKMPVFIDQVVGDQRQNRPSLKVIPVDSVADPEVATILDGWIKHVQEISKSDIAIDHGFEHAVASGYGALRVITKYLSDDSWDQEAYIAKIDNALAVWWGPHSEYDCSDAEYCFIVEDLPKEEFNEKHGETPVAFQEGDAQFLDGWVTKDKVRVAEYFVKEKVTKTLYLLADKTTVTKLPEGQTAIKTRKSEGYKIKWYLLSGDKVLEEKEWVGKKYIPIIPIWGKEIFIGAKRSVRSLIRYAKDAQAMYNFWESSDTELVALAPKAPIFVTAKQIGDNKSQWDNMDKKNYPYLVVGEDPKAPGWPQRQNPPMASTGMAERIRDTDQEIRDVIGLQKASLGMQSNERSGAAIRERKREGDVGTFPFIDNLARSMEHLGRVLVDIAPGVLDTERIIRLGLGDGQYKYDAVNVETPEGKILHDLSVGTYDIVVTVGPSFTTQRTEARESMKEFIQYYPAAAPIIGDLYAKAMDWAGAQEFSKRLEFMLPPEIKAMIAQEEAKNMGQEMPPPVQQPAPPPPPEQVLKVQQEEQKLKELQIKTAQEEEKLKGLQIANQITASTAKDTLKQVVDQILAEGEQEASKQIPGRAEGGPVKAGESYIVGENLRPELFVPDQDGLVIPDIEPVRLAVDQHFASMSGTPGWTYKDSADIVLAALRKQQGLVKPKPVDTSSNYTVQSSELENVLP